MNVFFLAIIPVTGGWFLISPIFSITVIFSVLKQLCEYFIIVDKQQTILLLLINYTLYDIILYHQHVLNNLTTAVKHAFS